MTLTNTITLTTVADNHFAVLLAALIKSIEINHRSGEDIHIYIVDDGLSEANRQKLMNSISQEKIQIFWTKIEDAVPSHLSLPLDNSSFPLNTYVRLCLPFYIPQNVDKVIYLDADMIVLEDISKLWHTDLNGKVIAGVVDRSEVVSSSWGGIQNYKELGLHHDTKYFNAGLLMIDLNKWRQQNFTEVVLKCISENRKCATFPDQYGLNVVFANQWLELNSLWNCIPMRNEKNPYLIHFIGRKPIFKGYNYNPKYKEQFFEYVNQTEWKNYRQKSEMNRLAKKLYNVVTKKIKRMVEA